MSDSQNDDLKKRLGIDEDSSAQPGGQESGGVPPPVVGGGANVPPPVVGGGAAVPPPVFNPSSAIPPPAFGKKAVEVAPPPFLVKKKRKLIRKNIIEVFEDVGPVIDRKAIARRKKIIITCAVIALPMIIAFFYIGKQRQTWALTDRSRLDASKIVANLSKAGPVYQQVQERTAAALVKGKANEVDTGYLNFTREMFDQRPLTNNDLDMLNYAAFDPQTVDQSFELLRVSDLLWGELAAHRNATRVDLDALQSHSSLGVPPQQTLYGVLTTPLDQWTLGANVGVISHPSKNDAGEPTLDMQVRPGRKAHPIKHYTKGPFGKKIGEWVIRMDPAQSADGEPLAKANDSHWTLYIQRLDKLNRLAGKTISLHGELTQKLGAISG